VFDRNPSEPDYADRLTPAIWRAAYADAQHLFQRGPQTLKNSRSIEIELPDGASEANADRVTAVHGHNHEAVVLDG